MAKEIRYLDLEGLKTLYGVVDDKIKTKIEGLDVTDTKVDGQFVDRVSEVDGKIQVSRSAVPADKVTATEITAVADGENATVAVTGTNVQSQIESLGKSVKAEESARVSAINSITNTINGLDLTTVGGTGKFVQSVSQEDGKVSAVAFDLNAKAVAATEVQATTNTVAINGTTVEDQIKSLGATLKTVESNAAHYKVAKLTEAEVNALPDSANVREAYKVVSWTGDEKTAIPVQVGETIKIYKDAALLSVTPEDGVAGENTVIKFTYSLANGKQKEVSVDLGKAIFESEMGNGMQVVDHKIAIKLDAANEGDFLTVGENGLKLSGVQDAINAAVAAKNVTATGDEYITVNAADNKVTVSADVQGLTVDKAGATDSTLAGVEKSLVDGKEVADKVSAFTNARIGEEVAKLDADVTSDANVSGGVAHKVRVQVVETDGKVSAVNVTENDIASAEALTDEVNRAKAAEDKIEASVGLADDGSFVAPTDKNYINNATTVLDAILKLDAQLKTTTDAILTNSSVDEDNKIVTINGKGLKFIALTEAEIKNPSATTTA